MQEGSGLRLLGCERVVVLLGQTLAGPAVPVPIETMHVVLSAAAGPVDRLRLELHAEVAAVVGIDAALAKRTDCL